MRYKCLIRSRWRGRTRLGPTAVADSLSAKYFSNFENVPHITRSTLSHTLMEQGKKGCLETVSNSQPAKAIDLHICPSMLQYADDSNKSISSMRTAKLHNIHAHNQKADSQLCTLAAFCMPCPIDLAEQRATRGMQSLEPILASSISSLHCIRWPAKGCPICRWNTLSSFFPRKHGYTVTQKGS